MIYLEKNNLKQLIEKGIYLVDFYADWCGPCKMMEPVLQNLDESINVIKVNVDLFKEEAAEYSIMNIPTLLYFKDGALVNKSIGFVSKEEIEQNIKEIS